MSRTSAWAMEPGGGREEGGGLGIGWHFEREDERGKKRLGEKRKPIGAIAGKEGEREC